MFQQIHLPFFQYPSVSPTSSNYKSIRAGAHSDYGSLTLLFRLPGQAGLEILTPHSTWLPVPVVPPDLLSHWTEGLLKSTVHRVVFPNAEENGKSKEWTTGRNEDDRYSIAYFFHPCRDTELVQVPSDMVRARRQVGKSEGVFTASEHLNGRLAETYGWRKENMVA